MPVRGGGGACRRAAGAPCARLPHTALAAGGWARWRPAPHSLTSLPHQGRQNISPDKIPWSALKTLMAQSIYGGRVDNEFDQRLLNTFLERLFTTKSFDSEFKLACKVDGHKDIQMPDGIRYAPASPDHAAAAPGCSRRRP